ncbi:hypothetical protein GS597_05025 [Synechococcales cyanobacterium C]|uniref:TPR repeat-containing protein n=1 Tax=Petrachloros mirabilis ULC683 TaxID=2781853 RepID=A0A8K1ZVY4_9CYAN|nr:hypothetical protein [Petrachloros mirabilis]NCJ05883.1 hypothetical protein [Petrachloros mirabilis ULC683]
MTTQPAETLFDEGIQRYQAGEPVADLIPVFKDICDRAPRNSPAWTCLSWLYLLADKPTAAYKAAQKAVKYNPEDPQGRVNLAIAMLETQQKGVRPHIELVQQMMMVSELRAEIEKSLEDGLARKPDWPSLQKVQAWIMES